SLTVSQRSSAGGKSGDQHPTSNVDHRTRLDTIASLGVGCWMFGVGCCAAFRFRLRRAESNENPPCPPALQPKFLSVLLAGDEHRAGSNLRPEQGLLVSAVGERQDDLAAFRGGA